MALTSELAPASDGSARPPTVTSTYSKHSVDGDTTILGAPRAGVNTSRYSLTAPAIIGGQWDITSGAP